MREVTVNPELVAFCGLYCGACRAYLQDRCPGCRKNEKAAWCKIRSCCLKNGRANCADCGQFPDPKDCKYFNNLIAKLFGLIFRSDRAACIQQIKKIGLKAHADDMASKKRQTIRK
jgi:hypothetical protein